MNYLGFFNFAVLSFFAISILQITLSEITPERQGKFIVLIDGQWKDRACKSCHGRLGFHWKRKFFCSVLCEHPKNITTTHPSNNMSTQVSMSPHSSTISMSSQSKGSTMSMSSRSTGSIINMSSQSTESTINMSSRSTVSTINISSQSTGSTISMSSKSTESTSKLTTPGSTTQKGNTKMPSTLTASTQTAKSTQI